ncbi:hypothetical protein Raf01_71510 [Rugosimonospora africana]|uniref:Uncharacterized protein n=1 Tax=Rugosimonospora africana TaxID=556532 RepID=A0A8J3QXH4_9ACTN|nr:hypothetical protein Raf01_71510 [Rugosimonospora africana]
MFRFEPGVTGFRDRNKPELPLTDIRTFRAACDAAARAAEGTVDRITERTYPVDRVRSPQHRLLALSGIIHGFAKLNPRVRGHGLHAHEQATARLSAQRSRHTHQSINRARRVTQVLRPDKSHCRLSGARTSVTDQSRDVGDTSG